MCFEIGNKVAVLDDVIKGIVIKMTNKIITMKDNEGMLYDFNTSELVKIGVEQNDLAKYSDIDNPLLKEKIDEKVRKKSFFVKEKNEILLEVDLHIHQLTKSTKGMNNYDMLSLQINTAQKKMEYAIEKRISKIIFIHGVGEGVLKSELQFLFAKYPVKYYDASYKKYGLGATEVYIYQNPN